MTRHRSRCDRLSRPGKSPRPPLALPPPKAASRAVHSTIKSTSFFRLCFPCLCSAVSSAWNSRGWKSPERPFLAEAPALDGTGGAFASECPAVAMPWVENMLHVCYMLSWYQIVSNLKPGCRCGARRSGARGMPVAAATLLMGATVALLALPSGRPEGMPHCRRLDGSGVALRGAPAATMRAGGSPDIAPTSAEPSAAKQTATPEMLRLGAVRAAGVGFGSLAVLTLLLPGAPDFWQAAEGATLLPPAPLLTLGGMLCLVVAGWSAFGTEMHPITAKARGLVPLPGYSFQILGLSAVVLSSASVALSWYPLPFAAATPAGSLPLELAHCVVPVALWQADAWLLRYLNPHVEWAADSTSLSSNYRAEHGASLLGAALALLGVAWFEVYVQQMIAVPLTLAGWPLLASAGVIALNAGLVRERGRVAARMPQSNPHVLNWCCRVLETQAPPLSRPPRYPTPPPQLNHALANGLLNGIACAEFYWTVSLLFSLSGSALPVGIYHHLM
eukprot:scaffold13627_cov109-Isochrysis_galbana.AAC.8